jgi:hypothetical protein
MRPIYWTQKDGTKILVDDMDTNHLRNTLKMIIRNKARLEAEQKSKPAPKFELHGDIAQDHYDTMMQEIYEEEMGIDFFGL